MSSQGIAVQDRLGDTTDHASPPDGKPAPRGSGPFLYASGARPLAGYVIKRGVGSGGFGEVYYATSDAGKEVALKLIRRNLDTELRGMQQCLNFKHPNLLTLFDIRQDDSGDTWVVMEYMSGKCLEAELTDHPQGLPLAEALPWFYGMAAGVAYLHDHGIVHRDLKPGNIFRDEGAVKVGDYGLSKFISCSRRSGHTESIGTVHYMAPEVAHGRYGKELDIYALGAILYELLTGRVPFDGESVGEVLMKHLTAQPDVSCLAEPYRSVVARAMEKDPARRFATVGQLLAAMPAHPAFQPGPPPASQTFRPDEQAARQAERNGWTGTSQAEPPRQAGKPEVQLGPDGEQEPIAEFVSLQVQKLRRRWQRVDLHPGAKRLILAAVIFFLLCTAGAWLPAGMIALVVYGGYRIARFFYRLWLGPSFPPARPVAVTMARPPRPIARDLPPPAVVRKPLAVRMADLVGSLLAAAAVTAVMCLVMQPIAAYCGIPLQIEQTAWLYLVSLVGAWLVLVTAKVWEGTRGEQILRHFILMMIGFGLGLTAFGTAEVLLVRVPMDQEYSHWAARAVPATIDRGGSKPYANAATRPWIPSVVYQDGRPTAMAYLATFAALLGLLRWWVDADPMRSARLNLWSLLITVFAAYCVALACRFPSPALMMVAACMSVGVQLSSPWVPTYARLRPQRKKVI
jgi:hypothetical protein